MTRILASDNHKRFVYTYNGQATLKYRFPIYRKISNKSRYKPCRIIDLIPIPEEHVAGMLVMYKYAVAKTHTIR